MSRTYRTRPSELYGITDDFRAWSFDRAVAHFGQAVEDEMEQASRTAKDQKGAQRKAELVLERWLRDPTPASQQVKRFRDPAEAFRKG